MHLRDLRGHDIGHVVVPRRRREHRPAHRDLPRDLRGHRGALRLVAVEVVDAVPNPGIRGEDRTGCAGDLGEREGEDAAGDL